MEEKGWPSISTPGLVHKRPVPFLCELIMINRDDGLKIYPLFWQDKKYQKSYQGLIINLSKRLKYISFDIAYKVIIENKLTHINEEFDQLVIEELNNG